MFERVWLGASDAATAMDGRAGDAEAGDAEAGEYVPAHPMLCPGF